MKNFSAAMAAALTRRGATIGSLTHRRTRRQFHRACTAGVHVPERGSLRHTAMATHGLQLRAIGKALRRVGQSVDRLGQGFMGDEGYVEHRKLLIGYVGILDRRLCGARNLSQSYATDFVCSSCEPAVVASTRVVSLKDKKFVYGLQNFVASSASVVGAVQFGEMSSLWYGATVRGGWRRDTRALRLYIRATRKPPPPVQPFTNTHVCCVFLTQAIRRA